MKKLFLLPLLGLFFMGCSVDNEDLNLPENQIQDLNAAYSMGEPCGDATSFYFNDKGHIEVVNDEHKLYVTIIAGEGSFISNTKLHLANGLSGFPTVGQGNLPPGQMDYNEDFNSDQTTYTFEFDLTEFTEFADEDGDGYQEISIASKTDFTNGDGGWAGDFSGNSGGWSYFNYEIQPCEVGEDPCAGIDDPIYEEVCPSDINNPSLLGFTNFYKNQIFLNTDFTTITGSFNPTLADLHAEFLADGPVGTWTTYYTVTTEDCGEITIEVSVDVNEDHCTL